MRKKRGFTLIEMLVVIAIVSILLTIGFGALNRYRQSVVLQSAVQQMSASINQARSDAQRLSEDQEVYWDETSFQGVAFENGITLSSGKGSFTFTAPYGRVKRSDSKVEDGLVLTLEGRNKRETSILIMGALGRVYTKSQ